MLPGWDSVEVTSAYAKWFTYAGFAALFLLGVFEILGHVYTVREATLKEAARDRDADNKRAESDARIAEAQRGISEAKEREKQYESLIAEANRSAAEANLKAIRLQARFIPLKISKNQELDLCKRLSEIPGMVVNLIAPPGPHILPDPRSGERVWLAFGLPPAKTAGWDPRLLLSNDRTELGVVVRTRSKAGPDIRKIAQRIVDAMIASGIEQAVLGPDFDESETPSGSEAGPTNKWAPDANIWIVVGS